MKDATWCAIEEIFEEFPMMSYGEVDIAEVDDAAEKIGIRFDEDYREFVRRYGGAIVGPYPVFGVRRAEPMAINEESVVNVTQRFRYGRWPGTDAWVVFSVDHAGNPFGFDREGKIWISDHDAGIVEVVANNFEEFLRKRCLKLPN